MLGIKPLLLRHDNHHYRTLYLAMTAFCQRFSNGAAPNKKLLLYLLHSFSSNRIIIAPNDVACYNFKYSRLNIAAHVIQVIIPIGQLCKTSKNHYDDQRPSIQLMIHFSVILTIHLNSYTLFCDTEMAICLTIGTIGKT